MNDVSTTQYMPHTGQVQCLANTGEGVEIKKYDQEIRSSIRSRNTMKHPISPRKHKEQIFETFKYNNRQHVEE